MGLTGWMQTLWLRICFSTCMHTRIIPSEGKCYCPDCGYGLIYQWVILRCAACATRLEGRRLFQTLKPATRFCTDCGSRGFRLEILDTPGYFKLEKAWLIEYEETRYLKTIFRIILDKLAHFAVGTLENAGIWTFAWLDPTPASGIRRPLLSGGKAGKQSTQRYPA